MARGESIVVELTPMALAYMAWRQERIEAGQCVTATAPMEVWEAAWKAAEHWVRSSTTDARSRRGQER